MVNNINNVYSNIKAIKREALEDNIPIMQDDTIDFITDYIADKRIKKVLEIGTAVGYSAIMMALSSPLVTVVTIEKEKFDLIIIDAAKSKNKEFFSHFESNLDTNGSIITDNLSFHGFVKKDLKEITSKNVRGLVKKIRAYIEFLNDNIKYKTKFYELGDGISVTERRLK